MTCKKCFWILCGLIDAYEINPKSCEELLYINRLIIFKKSRNSNLTIFPNWKTIQIGARNA